MRVPPLKVPCETIQKLTSWVCGTNAATWSGNGPLSSIMRVAPPSGQSFRYTSVEYLRPRFTSTLTLTLTLTRTLTLAHTITHTHAHTLSLSHTNTLRTQAEYLRSQFKNNHFAEM